MKYVILKLTIDAGLHKAFPYIFCDHDVHSVVAEHMTQMLLKQYKDKEVSLHSAGFCGPAENGFECYRGSSSLNIEETQVHCPEDERLLKFIDSTGGILSNDVDAMLDKLENHQREIKNSADKLGQAIDEFKHGPTRVSTERKTMTFEEYRDKEGFPLTSTQEPTWRRCWEAAQAAARAQAEAELDSGCPCGCISAGDIK